MKPIIMSVYDLNVIDIDGKERNLSEFKGKPSLIVNVASQCGFTPQYTGLQNLYKEYNGKINILGFPCNQFGKQEPGSSEEIKEFCSSKYQVTFPIFEKVEVKGSNAAPVYQYLNSHMNQEPKWNFHKYLVDKNGVVRGSFPSKVKPLDEKLVTEIEKLI